MSVEKGEMRNDQSFVAVWAFEGFRSAGLSLRRPLVYALHIGLFFLSRSVS